MYLKVLLSMVLICIAASCDVVMDKFGWLPRYQISNGAFLTLYGTGWTGCWEACLHRKMCLSVSYNTDTLKCSLGKFADNKTYTGHASDVFMTPDWNGNPPEGQGPCKSRPCTLTKRCVPLWNGNHTCITEMKSVDLCVLLDVSGTTSASKFQNMVDSLLEVIGQLHDVRLAVTYFGNNNPEVKFGFDQTLMNKTR
ncbi:uncharacterized protein LOC117317962 [Pecten maximus]|uniref:uncharacterized protein LOC117317962 n=1 Tax=Pecten maximus TaxID=6579 RepID=UPI001458084E|nr:uncharacterized protein LOC117317962 [Pecten maximus]